MITAKLNLRQLEHAIMKTPIGNEVIVIPIEKNNLFKGEKGIYLDLVGFEIKKPGEGQKDTHILKQSFSKEKLEKMTDDEKKALPILGNATVMTGSGSRSEAEPKDANNGTVADGINQLPF